LSIYHLDGGNFYIFLTNATYDNTYNFSRALYVREGRIYVLDKNDTKIKRFEIEKVSGYDIRFIN